MGPGLSSGFFRSTTITFLVSTIHEEIHQHRTWSIQRLPIIHHCEDSKPSPSNREKTDHIVVGGGVCSRRMPKPNIVKGLEKVKKNNEDVSGNRYHTRGNRFVNKV